MNESLAATELHGRLQVAIAEAWDRDDHAHRMTHAKQASKLAHQLYKLGETNARQSSATTSQ